MKAMVNLIEKAQTQAYRVWRNQLQHVLDKYHITLTYWSILGLINDSKQGIKSSDIAANMHVKPPLITAITRDLILRQYIIGVPHELDGRARLLRITPKGRRFIKNVDLDLDRLLSALFDGLTESELENYEHALMTIIHNSEKLSLGS